MLPLVGPLTIPTFFIGFLIILVFRWFTYKPEEEEDEVIPPVQSETKAATDNPELKPNLRADPKPVKVTENGIKIISSPTPQVPVENGDDSSCACKQNGSAATSCCKTNGSVVSGPKKFDKLTILYGTSTGNSEKFARKFGSKAEVDLGLECEVVNMADCEAEERLPAEAASPSNLLIIITSTYTEGSPPESAKWFFNWVQEAAQDFRVQHSLLNGLNYCVLGLGSSIYQEFYNIAARQMDKFLFQLSATRFHPLTLLDENESGTKNGSMEADYEEWEKKLLTRIKKTLDQDTDAGCCKENDEEDNEEEIESSDEEDDDDDGNNEDLGSDGEGLVDLEDLGSYMQKAKAEKSKQVKAQQNGVAKEMVTPLVRKSLTKQGYKVIGSHSAVKICRWTKAMLRGRGGCYKHSFYGIASHQCMETTPSLACANKCVFCWRHHSNPVGTEWRWTMDPPEMIIDGALENHYKMIKQMKGVPGVLPEKLEEGLNVQHCALSLVGEPIMYPEINKFVKILHQRRISSFLVTNAQFPDEMRRMEPCTQLYVSIDAATKDSLKKIDRPLHRDFWERFTECLTELSAKGQRTVYRLTIVKGFNEIEIDNYAKLVTLGKPDFIEVKGVTYCGTSKASTLTMDNVPWHEEVIEFVEKLSERLTGYAMACEHEHSNCILLADKKFLIDGKWNTWIDYQKFHDLAHEYYENGTTFTSMDYLAPTPAWAVYGSEERGFDPHEKRFHRKQKNNDG